MELSFWHLICVIASLPANEPHSACYIQHSASFSIQADSYNKILT